MKLLIELTPEEIAYLKALAIRFGTSPQGILVQFASDLTGSLRTHGSDEQDCAMRYVKRAFFDRQAAYCPEGEAITEKEQDQIDRFYEEVMRHRSAVEVARRAERASLQII